ncbi:MAG: glycosyltransferase family 9 protein [Planctomycetota bacterium]
MNLAFGKFVDRWIGIPLVFLGRILSALSSPLRPKPKKNEIADLRCIALIKLWGAGNVVLIMPIIRRLKQRYPQARLVFLTLPGNRELLEPMPEVDEVLTFDIASLPRLFMSLPKAAFALRSSKPDIVLDFEQFCRLSALLTWFSGAAQRVGLRTPGQARAGLYTAVVPYCNDQHMSQTFFDLGRVLGLEGSYRPEPLPLDAAAQEAAAVILKEAKSLAAKGPLCVFHIGSGDNFIGRRWPEARFTELIRRLQQRHQARVILTGVPAELPLIESCVANLSQPVVRAAGRLSIPAFAALLNHVDALFCNDTLPVHLASATGCPVFAFYGPNTPALYGPLHERGQVFYRDLPCSPCLTNLNAKESRCRLPICIESIEVDEVDAAFAEFWAAPVSRLSSGAAGSAEGVQAKQPRVNPLPNPRQTRPR